MSDAQKIWNKLLDLTGSKNFTAAIMGNMQAESALRANNVQNSYESAVGNDTTYTAKIDNLSYPRNSFANDKAGYGLIQWTYHTRKAALYDYWQESGYKSIGDPLMQCEFCVKELKQSYNSIWLLAGTATSIEDLTRIICTKYERPANQSDAAINNRIKYAKQIYSAFHDQNAATETIDDIINQVEIIRDMLQSLKKIYM